MSIHKDLKKVYYFRCVTCRSLIKEGSLDATSEDPGGFIHGRCPCSPDPHGDEGVAFNVTWKYEEE